MNFAFYQRGIISKFYDKAVLMQDILSFVQPASPLPVTANTAKPIENEGTEGSFAESFFSMILGEFTQEESSSLELSQNLPQLSLDETLTNLDSTTQEAKSIDEHLLEDLLSVVSALQQNPQTTTFPSLNSSSNLEKILGSETARQDFANAKSVSDLLDLSKKYNLGLEKLSISQETVENLQTKFPSLTQNNFFDDLQTALNNTQTNSTTQLTNNSTTNNTTPASTLMSLLGTQEMTKKENTPSTTSLLSEIFSKDTLANSSINTTQNDADVNTTSLMEETHLLSEITQNAEEIETTTKETLAPTTKPLESVIQKVVSNTQETKKTTNSSDKTSTIDDKLTSIHTDDTKKVSISSEETSLKEEITKSLKTETTTEPNNEAEITQTQVKSSTEEKELAEMSSDDTSFSLDAKSDIKTTAKQDLSSKTTTPKESLNQFASDLKEQIETYKPPIMKVELSLSPKSLGDVDVTLLTRGNNLHVNISSNTTTMNLFTQNQDEVKSALVSMGFTNLEMNFSDQRNKEQAQQNQKNSNGKLDEFSTEQLEGETASLEIVIPQYV